MGEWLISPPLLFTQITYCIRKNIHTNPHTHTYSHSCTAVRVGGALPFWWETERERGRGSYCDWVQRESHWTVGKALSPFTHCGQLCAMAVCVQWVSHLIKGYTQGRVTTMQGRAGKAPKREMVIESPQQYKCLAEIEAEVEAGSQVAAVSALRVIFYIEVFLKNSCSGSCSLKGTTVIWLFNQAFLSLRFPFKSSFEDNLKRVRRKSEIAASGYTSLGGWMLIFFRKWSACGSRCSLTVSLHLSQGVW